MVTYDMVRIGAVTVSTRPNARQDWLPIKEWHRQGFLVKLTLPGDALLRAVFDDQGSMHTTRLALEVFPLTLMCVDLPGCSTSATQGHIVIHAIILALDNSGQVTLEPESYFTQATLSVLCDLHNHPGLLPLELVLSD